jgi:hypothetical protein
MWKQNIIQFKTLYIGDLKYTLVEIKYSDALQV